jgi:hypothetical protein
MLLLRYFMLQFSLRETGEDQHQIFATGNSTRFSGKVMGHVHVPHFCFDVSCGVIPPFQNLA